MATVSRHRADRIQGRHGFGSDPGDTKRPGVALATAGYLAAVVTVPVATAAGVTALALVVRAVRRRATAHPSSASTSGRPRRARKPRPDARRRATPS
jgi:hypothetical protein